MPVSALPKDEQEEAAHLDLLVLELDGYLSQFRSALGLFHFCDALMQAVAETQERPVALPPTAWLQIAARDAALSVYHFGVVLAAIHARIGLCPTLIAHFDGTEMKRARRLLNQHFAKSTKLRHAIAHDSEMLQNPGKLKRHIIGGDGMLSRFGVSNSLNGNRFVTTWEGAQLTLDTEQNTVTKLTEIRNAVFAAFRPVEVALRGKPASA